MKSSVRLNLIFGCAIAISLLFLLATHTHKTVNKHQKNSLDSFMQNATYVHYDDKGVLANYMTAEKVTYYSNHSTSFFVKPKMLVYTTDHIPWHIHADYGKSIDGSKIVYLHKNVWLQRSKTRNTPKTTITTSAMTVYPKRSLAVSKREVTVHRPGTTFKGVGVQANLKTGVFKSFSHSRGVYIPNSS